MKASSESGEWATRIVRGSAMVAGRLIASGRGGPRIASLHPAEEPTMRNGMLVATLGAVAALAAGAAAIAQDGGKGKAMAGTPIAVGTEAPDFRLNDQDGKGARRSSFRGKTRAGLDFFPKALNGACNLKVYSLPDATHN